MAESERCNEHSRVPNTKAPNIKCTHWQCSGGNWDSKLKFRRHIKNAKRKEQRNSNEPKRINNVESHLPTEKSEVPVFRQQNQRGRPVKSEVTPRAQRARDAKG